MAWADFSRIAEKNRTMKTLMIIIVLFVTGTSWGQKAPKTATVIIHTSAECGECELRLEEGLNFTKGVVFAELNLDTRDITIKYSTKKTSLEELRKVINGLGYDADGQKAEAAALEKLPSCCRPGGMEKKD